MIYVVMFLMICFILAAALCLDKEDGSIYWDEDSEPT